MITDKSLRLNLKKFGFSSYDIELKDTVYEFLTAFLKNKLKKVTKGGKIVLPSEYFGKESSSYFESLDNNGANMSVTDSMIRPSIPASDVTGAITGGAVLSFKIPMNTFTMALADAKDFDIKIPKSNALKLKEEFEELLTTLMTKLSKKKKTHLEIKDVQAEAKKRQYKAFF